jgi:hypothetical protein
MTATCRLFEFVASASPLRIDREKGVIYGVKILGERSTNPPPRDNEYPASTRRDAIAMIEGARVCIDHPDMKDAGKTRSYHDAIGVHRNVEERGDGLYGDFHFNPKHPLAEQIFWDAENAPQNLGFSINADGRVGRGESGRQVVQEIVKVYSVDLVSRPATTVGLFESASEGKPMKSTVKKLAESLKAKRPGYAKALLEMAESGLLSSDAKMDEPAPMGDEPPPEDADHKEALKTGFRAAVMAVLDDDSLDMMGKRKKIGDILSSWDKLVNGDEAAEEEGEGEELEEGEDSDADAGEKKIEEEADCAPKDKMNESGKNKGAILEAENAALRLQLKARDMLAAADVKRSPVIDMALDACKTEADVRKLIESVQAERKEEKGETRPAPSAKRPKSAPGGVTKTVQESASSKLPTDPKEFARACKN